MRMLVLAAALAGPASVGACELQLAEHRSGRVLLRLALPAPTFEIAFEHSVLGTTIVDRYEVRGTGTPARLHLVEERFSGEGYGLPYGAAPGERLERDSEGWRLHLDRAVDPLVVRPLRPQRTRLRVAGREWLLADLTHQAIELQAGACLTHGRTAS